jgi:pyruvate/2-oxoglutarate dehydrogenase complex dihydrolipoamide dehydrogenase (E3) component
LFQAAASNALNLDKIYVHYEDQEEAVLYDTVLFATGRQPNVNGLGLDAAGVEFSQEDGIYVNEFLQTTNQSIYSVGDCLAEAMSKEEAKTNLGPGPQFTHNSDVHARSVVRNALFFGRIDRRDFLLPWTTYTDPEISHVGKYAW